MSEIDIIDVEASGLHFESYPIEVGVRINGEVHAWLIRPEAKWTHWDAAAEALHGLSREQLLREGQSAASVAAELNRLFADTHGIVYSDAAPWDDDWVKMLYRAAGVQRQWHILPIDDLMSDAANLEFKRVLKNLQLASRTQRHRAGPDIELIRQAYVVASKLDM